MILLYGGVPLGGANAGQFTWGRELLQNAAGIGYGLQWSVRCSSMRVRIAGPAQADAAILTVQQALALPFQNLVFQNDDGTPSGKSVGDAATFTGVQCVSGPTWSDRAGAQHVTFLEFSCAFRWETHFAVPGDFLLDWSESVTVRGGKPLAVVLEPLNAGPELQVTVPEQGYSAVQEGYAEGLTAHPTPPTPLPGLGVCVDNPVSAVSPRRAGRGKRGYAIRWRYQFVKASVPFGAPTEWST